MNFTSLVSRRLITAASMVAVSALGILPAAASASADTPAASASYKQGAATPSQILASTAWKTTDALDAHGQHVALSDPAVSNFVGWAYFKSDGTFTMYNLDNSPKMHGDWTVPADGSARTIVAKDDAGTVLFTRVTPIVELTKHTFTYRVYPNAADQSVYYDIVHTPTKHVEPGSGQNGPGANGNQGNQGNQGNGHYHYNNGNHH